MYGFLFIRGTWANMNFHFCLTGFCRFPDVFIKRRPGPKRLKSPLLPLVQASAQIRRTVSESAKTRRPEPPRSAFTPVKWSSSSSSQAGLTCGRGNLSISSTLMSSSTEILEALEMGSAHACEKRRSAVIEVWSEQSHSLSCSAPFHYNATCQ